MITGKRPRGIRGEHVEKTVGKREEWAEGVAGWAGRAGGRRSSREIGGGREPGDGGQLAGSRKERIPRTWPNLLRILSFREGEP